jgi:hypothetical protein
MAFVLCDMEVNIFTLLSASYVNSISIVHVINEGKRVEATLSLSLFNSLSKCCFYATCWGHAVKVAIDMWREGEQEKLPLFFLAKNKYLVSLSSMISHIEIHSFRLA